MNNKTKRDVIGHILCIFILGLERRYAALFFAVNPEPYFARKVKGNYGI